MAEQQRIIEKEQRKRMKAKRAERRKENAALGIVEPELWEQICQAALALFARGTEVAARNGMILVDTKYEFGVDEEGRIRLADEIHTPDSSRYWTADSYPARFEAGGNPESLDKEFLRLWVAERCDPYKDPIPKIPNVTLLEFSAKYVSLFETVTGRVFQYADAGEPLRERIHAALASELPDYF